MVGLDNIFPSQPVGCFAFGMILGCVSTAYSKPIGIATTIMVSVAALYFYEIFADAMEDVE
jgi:hypothetical protein